jgi:hypothetical protein
LVGADGLWLTTNAKTPLVGTPPNAYGVSWANIKPTVQTGNYISAIAVAPGDSNKIWVGHNNGNLYCTTTGAAPWTQVSFGGAPSRIVLRITVDPSNPNRVWVMYGGYVSPNLYELTHATQVCTAVPTATARHNNLPVAPVRSLLRHPAQTNTLYAGLEVGVFASIDGGTTWSTSNEGPGNVPVDELFWIDNSTLGAATHGRGMFKTTVSPGTLQFSGPSSSVAENGVQVTVSVSRTGGSVGAVQVTYSTVPEVGLGKATSGTDYPFTTGNLNWADGDTADKTFNVTITDDAVYEGNETFRIDLSAPTAGAVLGGTTSHTVTIIDNETPPPVGKTRFDFNGDSRADIFWRHMGAGGTGQNYIFPMNGTTILGSEAYVRSIADLNWQIVGMGDLDGDGKADILWRHATTGDNYLWPMNSTTIKATEGYLRSVTDANWKVAAIADFDGNGNDDILWRNISTGENYIYFMNGTTISSEGYIRSVVPAWTVVGAGDFDGDGKADILWRNASTGENYLFPMNGLAIKPTEAYFRSVAAPWTVAGLGDFDGDGKTDILWRNTTTGENYIFPMNGTAIKGTETYIRTVPTIWSVVMVADFNADGTADILWRNNTSGDNYLFPMVGLNIGGTEAYLRNVAGPNWTISNK